MNRKLLQVRDHSGLKKKKHDIKFSRLIGNSTGWLSLLFLQFCPIKLMSKIPGLNETFKPPVLIFSC